MVLGNLADAELPFIINSSELDFLTLIEHGIRPPIAFKSRTHLDAWAAAHELEPTELGKRNPEKSVVFLIGKVGAPGYEGGLHYGQVWAHADYDYYRNALKFRIRTMEGRKKEVSTHDADHAVARSHFRGVWPDAWINILLVEKGVNRSIGAMMEKLDSRIDFSRDDVKISAECILKVFYEREASLSCARVGEYLAKAARRFIRFECSPKRDEQTLLDELIMSRNADRILNEIAAEFDGRLVGPNAPRF